MCARGVQTDLLARLGIVPPLVATGLLFFGIWQLGSFQKQERVWVAALDRAQLLALIILGLSPFLYWWNHVPGNRYFECAALLVNFGGLVFLFSGEYVAGTARRDAAG